ncbi:MAG: hypothetical protein ACYTHK_12120 [Planctomycetota bacterium]|jgi:hypothetical protein
MNPRWWRIAILYEEDGTPWTWTFHVRAFTEKAARTLVEQRVDREFAVYVCHPSDPLPTAPREEEIAADYGPWKRDWDDPTIAELREKLPASGFQLPARKGRKPEAGS